MNRFYILLLLLLSASARAQVKDSLKIPPPADAAERYYDTSHAAVHVGGSLREVYEHYNNYLWGIGPQDHNGYFLHRILLHADVRYNRHWRLFTELQSSFLSARNGGARPVQDLNKLAFTQLFAEYSTQTKNNTKLKVRIGEQALNYGVGSLLDIRDANVHRSFAGAKFIMEKGSSRLDVFAMELINTNTGFFDDRIDPSQKIAGAWFVQGYKNSWLNKLELFYLYTDRKPAGFTKDTGEERRHTIGTGLTFRKGGWSAYTEGDLQMGTYDHVNILAWKLTQTLGYQFQESPVKPDISIQSAVSSGDKNDADEKLQTFNPIYPKAIYYGFIDNVGASNLLLIHMKAGVQLFKTMNISTGYYRFWRKSSADGLYGPGGNYFLPASNSNKSVGRMYDLVAAYQQSAMFRITLIAAYYQRGSFLKANPATSHDIGYVGLNASFHF